MYVIQRTAPLRSVKLHKNKQNFMAKKVGSGSRKLMQIRPDPENCELNYFILPEET